MTLKSLVRSQQSHRTLITTTTSRRQRYDAGPTQEFSFTERLVCRAWASRDVFSVTASHDDCRDGVNDAIVLREGVIPLHQPLAANALVAGHSGCSAYVVPM